LTQPQNNAPSRRTILTILLSLVIFAGLTFFLAHDMDRFQSLIRQSGLAGILIGLVLYTLLGATVIPSEPLTMLFGALFGPLAATVIAGTGNVLAAVVEYYIGSKLAGAGGFVERKEKLPFGLGRLPVDSPVFLIAGRMVPGARPKLISVLGGCCRVPMVRYLWTTAIPTYIGAALFAYGGFGLQRLDVVAWFQSLF